MVFIGNAEVSSNLELASPFSDGWDSMGCNGGVRNSAEKLSSFASGFADRCGRLDAERASVWPVGSPDNKKGEARARLPVRSPTWGVGDSGRARYDANPGPG